MEDLAAGLDVRVVTTVDPVEAGEAGVRDVGQSGVVYPSLARDGLCQVVLGPDEVGGGEEGEQELGPHVERGREC